MNSKFCTHRLLLAHTGLVFGLFAVILPLLCTGCAAGAKLEARADEIQVILSQIEERAYNCAPKEYAKARAHNAFGIYELEQGDFVRAKEHLYLAETNAKAADKLSDFQQCLDTQVAIKVKTTDKAKIVAAKPTPTDKDGDGFLDKKDKCPDKPEDFDGYQDEDGCPEPDNDNDKIADEADRCPDVAEDVDQFQDEDGCPELDNDSDGIADLNDQCKNEPEDFDNFQDEDGCPDPDNDDDKIADVLDQCINKPEDYDNDQDEDGCPEERKLVKIEGDRIELGQKVFFKTGKSTIMPVSFGLLDEVADVLRQNSNIHIRIEGHTDDRGSNRYNKKLSQARAGSVLKYLKENGSIESYRMVATGFGEDRPIEDNTTDGGRAANRRVEIHITKK